jgi:hypothetical protein
MGACFAEVVQIRDMPKARNAGAWVGAGAGAAGMGYTALGTAPRLDRMGLAADQGPVTPAQRHLRPWYLAVRLFQVFGGFVRQQHLYSLLFESRDASSAPEPSTTNAGPQRPSLWRPHVVRINFTAQFRSVPSTPRSCPFPATRFPRGTTSTSTSPNSKRMHTTDCRRYVNNKPPTAVPPSRPHQALTPRASTRPLPQPPRQLARQPDITVSRATALRHQVSRIPSNRSRR